MYFRGELEGTSREDPEREYVEVEAYPFDQRVDEYAHLMAEEIDCNAVEGFQWELDVEIDMGKLSPSGLRLGSDPLLVQDGDPQTEIHRMVLASELQTMTDLAEHTETTARVRQTRLLVHDL